MTNKEVQERLNQFPEDAIVAVEYCNINSIKYHKETNLITID